jgi:hypothetical protein
LCLRQQSRSNPIASSRPCCERASAALWRHWAGRTVYAEEDNTVRQLLLIVGLLALAMGLLWIGQGTGVINWPQSSFMIKQIEWAGYGAAVSALGLILIWQSKR